MTQFKKWFWLSLLLSANTFSMAAHAATKPQAKLKPQKTNEITQPTPAADCIPLSWQGPDISFLLAGGASVGYAKPFGDTSSFNVVDLNPLLLFSYRDLLLMRSALDFAINDTGGTDVSLDNLNINIFLNDYVTFEMGKFDSGLGSFVQNISPSWINRLPDSPIGFDGDQAAPQSEIGARFQGGFRFTENTAMNYTVFIANGPQAFVDTTNNVIDHIGTDGFINNYGDFMYGGRIGFLPIPKFEVGVSAANGHAALIDMSDNSTVLARNGDYRVFGVDAAYKPGNWDFRGEYIQQQLMGDDEDEAVGEDMLTLESEKWRAWYLQVAYWIPDTQFEPVIRYGRYLAGDSSQNQRQWTFGLDYWFSSSAAAQIAYELNEGQPGTSADSNLLMMQLVFGY